MGSFGSVTKLPGRTPASIGMNRPPAAASKIVMVTTSPIPNLISGGGRLSGKVPAIPFGSYSARSLMTSGVILTRPYWTPRSDKPTSMATPEGPDTGVMIQPAQHNAAAITSALRNVTTPRTAPTFFEMRVSTEKLPENAQRYDPTQNQ